MNMKWTYPGRSVDWWRPEWAVEGPREAAVSAARPRNMDPSATAFWGLMAFTFVLVISPQNFLPIPLIRPALLAAGIAVAAYLLDRVRRGKSVTEFTPEILLAGLLSGWAVFTLPLSYWPGGSLSFLLDLYLKALLIFWLISQVVTSLSRLRIMAWSLALMSVLLAAAAASHFVSGRFVLDGSQRIFGYNAPLTANPNDLALMLNLILPLAVSLFRSVRTAMLRSVLAGIIFLDVTAVILTFSRAGFLTLGVLFAAHVWKLARQKRVGWVLGGLLIAVLAVAFFPSGYSERLSTISNFESDPTGSAQARWNDAKAALRLVLKQPVVGSGVGMDELAMNQERGPEWREIHNVYLQYAVELGIPGLLLFCLLFRSCYRSARWVQARFRAGAAGPETARLAEGIQISLLAFAVAALFYPVGYHFYFYYFAGMAVAVKRICAAEARE